MLKNLILSLTLVFCVLQFPFCGSRTENPVAPSKPFVPATGKIFRGKTSFRMDLDNMLRVVDWCSNFSMPSSDTTLPMQFRTKFKARNDSNEIIPNDYYISTEKGLQYKIPANQKDTVWLNAGSFARFSYLNGKCNNIMLQQGEAYIKAYDSMKIMIGDSLFIHCKQNDEFNIKYAVNESFIYISLARGAINIVSDNGSSTAMNTPGDQRAFPRFSAWGIVEKSLSPAQIGNWREANYLLFEEGEFWKVMERINRWYNTKTIDTTRDIVPDAVNLLSMPHDQHLDTALKFIQTAFHVKLTRRNDSIFVTGIK